MASTAVVTRDFLPSVRHGWPREPDTPTLLEFEVADRGAVEAPVKPAARSMLWIMVSAIVPPAWQFPRLFPIDMVVSGAGRVVSLQATNVVQPLETAIVRAINVREGQNVRAGDVLARLDPTFSGADVSALQAQMRKAFRPRSTASRRKPPGCRTSRPSADAPTALQLAIYRAAPGAVSLSDGELQSEDQRACRRS